MKNSLIYWTLFYLMRGIVKSEEIPCAAEGLKWQETDNILRITNQLETGEYRTLFFIGDPQQNVRSVHTVNWTDGYTKYKFINDYQVLQITVVNQNQSLRDVSNYKVDSERSIFGEEREPHSHEGLKFALVSLNIEQGIIIFESCDSSFAWAQSRNASQPLLNFPLHVAH